MNTASYKRWHLGPRPSGSETSPGLWQRIALITALVLGLSATLGAAQAFAGSISGTVTDEASGDPIEGISVEAQDDGGGYAGSAQTDATGKYTITGLGTADYIIRFDDYGSPREYLQEYYDDKQGFRSADPVSVTSGSDTQNIDAALTKGGSISGTVTDEASGDPIAGICVNVSNDDFGFYGSDRTDSNGDYKITGLRSGDYTVYFYDCTADEYLSEYYDDRSYPGDSVEVTAGSEIQNIDAALTKPGSISGTVTDEASGDPIAGICVQAEGASYGYDTTDSNGNYTITGLRPGDHTVYFYDCDGFPEDYLSEYYDDERFNADPVSVTSGSETQNIDAALTALGSISGTVTDETSGDPLADICVSAQTPDFGFYGSDRTDSDGNYKITGLRSGDYRVQFYDCDGPRTYVTEYYDDKESFDAADEVAVTEGSETQNIDAALTKGGSISGTVTDEASGDPIAGICVSAQGGSYGGSDTTDSDGNYKITGLRPGDHTVYFYDCDGFPEDYVSEYYDDERFSNNADPVAVTSGSETQNIDAALTKGGSISGTVTYEETGDPVAPVLVSAIDQNGNSIRNAIVFSGSSYEIAQLPPGEYRVEFDPNPFGDSPYDREYYDDKAKLDNADPVTVIAGAEIGGIDAELAKSEAPETTIDSGPSGTTDDRTPSFEFSANEQDSTFECRIDEGVWFACESPYTTFALADGPHRFQVRATDPAGNTDQSPASREFEVDSAPVDTQPPNTTIDSGPSGTTNNAWPSFGFSSSEVGSSFECELDGSGFSPCSSPRSYSNLPDGPHTFSVRATDQANNTDPSPASRSFTVDTTAPQTTINSGPQGSTDDASPSFGFSSSEGGSSFECELDGSGFSPCSSPRSYSNLPDGPHTFRVRATDPAGNTDQSPESREFEVDSAPVDTQPPNTTIDSGPSGTTNNASPSFGFSSSEGSSSFECRLDSESWSSCSSPKDYSNLPDGPHTFSVRATDQAGNTDPSPATRSFTVDTTPSGPGPEDTTIDGAVSAQKTQKQKGKKIVVKARVSASEDLSATGSGKIKIAKKSYKLKPQTKSVSEGKKKTLKLKPKKKQAKKIAKALKKGKGKAKLTVKLFDGAGNTETEKLGVKLK